MSLCDPHPASFASSLSDPPHKGEGSRNVSQRRLAKFGWISFLAFGGGNNQPCNKRCALVGLAGF